MVVKILTCTCVRCKCRSAQDNMTSELFENHIRWHADLQLAVAIGHF